MRGGDGGVPAKRAVDPHAQGFLTIILPVNDTGAARRTSKARRINPFAPAGLRTSDISSPPARKRIYSPWNLMSRGSMTLPARFRGLKS